MRQEEEIAGGEEGVAALDGEPCDCCRNYLQEPEAIRDAALATAAFGEKRSREKMESKDRDEQIKRVGLKDAQKVTVGERRVC